MTKNNVSLSLTLKKEHETRNYLLEETKQGNKTIS